MHYNFKKAWEYIKATIYTPVPLTTSNSIVTKAYPTIFDMYCCEDACTTCGSKDRENAQPLAIISGPLRWVCDKCYLKAIFAEEVDYDSMS